MAVEVALGTPLADRLAAVIKPKLCEVGWGSGDNDDSTLAEYIILMLGTGKTQEQIAADLSGDLLNLGPDDPGALDFARWLFDQVNILSSHGGGASQASSQVAPPQIQSAVEIPPTADVEMGNADVQAKIPTGPKVMPTARDKRMLNQMTRAMERRPNEKILHRINANHNTGRVSSHKDAARGPRASGIQNGPRPPTTNQGYSTQRPNPAAAVQQLSPEHQLAMLQFYEQSAKQMAAFLTGVASPPAAPSGPSLFDRVERPSTRSARGGRSGFNVRGRGGANHADRASPAGVGTDTSNTSPLDMPLSAAPTSPKDSTCKFNLRCTNPSCTYAHQSPAAPLGTPVDPNDTCSFGAACKNKKCVARHPSPASKQTFQSQQECRFWPRCTNPNCPFLHPEAPPCRNGADCSVPGCSFSHSNVACKFNPCLNAACIYKHAEGQKRGNFGDMVWTKDGKRGNHTSERTFVDGDAQEEFVGGDQAGGKHADGAVAPEVEVM